MKSAKLLLLIILTPLFCVPFLIQATKATTYTYTFNGPYYDGGDVANAAAGIAVQWVNGSLYYFNLTADGVTPDTETFYSTAPALLITWNASTLLNLTRVMEFTNATTQTYNVCIPPTVLPVGTYAFSVTDFYGMTSPYLQTSISPNGVDLWVVERRSLNSSNTVTFVMTQYGTYTVTIQCDQGNIVQTFTAENIFSIDYPVLSGAFPTSTEATQVFTAQRLNSSLMGISYNDYANVTTTFIANVTHKSGTNTINDYYYSGAGNSHTVLWNLADADLSYTVYAVGVLSTGVNKTWIMPVPKLPPANPFSGVFDWLGKGNLTMPHVHTGWPEGMTSAQIAQLVAAAIITLFLAVGSTRSAGACCVLAWIVAGVMLFLGWFGGGTTYASIPLFSLAGVLSVIIAIIEGKETVREV